MIIIFELINILQLLSGWKRTWKKKSGLNGKPTADLCDDRGLNVITLYSWVARDVTKNQTNKLSIVLSFYFHEALQYLNTFT